MSLVLEGLEGLRLKKFKEIRTYLNENIKFITDEEQLKKLMDRLNKYEWELEDIYKEIKLVEKKNNT